MRINGIRVSGSRIFLRQDPEFRQGSYGVSASKVSGLRG